MSYDLSTFDIGDMLKCSLQLICARRLAEPFGSRSEKKVMRTLFA